MDLSAHVKHDPFKHVLIIYSDGEQETIEDAVDQSFSRADIEPFSFDLLAVPNTQVVNFTATKDYKQADIIFLSNVVMIKPDGFEILELIFQTRPNIPIVVTSGLDADYFFSQVKYPLSITYLPKPYRMDHLRDAVLEKLFMAPARAGKGGMELITFSPPDINVIKYLSRNSKELYKIPDRFFEQLLAEMLFDRGWEVELSPIGADGGIDIVAIRKIEDISQMMLVQAKRYAEHRKVGVSVVRELLHVIDDKRATQGMIATTSAFTSVAKEEQHAYKWILSLRDHDQIVKWLQEYKSFRQGQGL